MTLAQHANLARALRDVEARLKGAAVSPPDHHGDPVDQLAARAEHEGAVLDRAALVERQRLILAALTRIETGTYGWCESCCQPIPAKRLTAIPWAIRCLECEHRFEVAQAQARTQRVRPAPEPEDEG